MGRMGLRLGKLFCDVDDFLHDCYTKSNEAYSVYGHRKSLYRKSKQGPDTIFQFYLWHVRGVHHGRLGP